MKKLGLLFLYIGYFLVLFINMVVPYDRIPPYSLTYRMVLAFLLAAILPAFLLILLWPRDK